MSSMTVTFAVRVPPGEDVDSAQKRLVDTAGRWVLMAVLSGSFDPMPPVTVQRTDVPVFVETGKQVMRHLEMVPEKRLQVATLLEARVEIEEES